MTRILKYVINAILVSMCCVGICVAFSVRPTHYSISRRHDVLAFYHGTNSLKQYHMMSNLRDSSTTKLYSITGSDLSDALLVATAFAGIAVYTYQNPDTSEKIREALDGTNESSSTSSPVEGTPIPTSSPTVVETTPVAVAAKPVVVPAVAPISKTKEQEQLSTLLQTVSKTVEEQSIKLDELESKKTETTSTPKGGKIKFVLKVVKKVVMPWKVWANL
jgi:hypothetical protein